MGRSHGGPRTSLYGAAEIPQILHFFVVKLKELTSTSLFDLLLFLYQEDVLLSSLDMSNFFSFLLCLPVDGFFQVGENSVTGSCKSMVHVARKLRLRSESQRIGHHNLWQLTNPSLSKLPMHRLIANISGCVVAGV